MATEIERKFLVVNDDWNKEVFKSVYFRQGYLSSDPSSSVRVRITDAKAWLNIKSATVGLSRLEFEYAIPLDDGVEMLDTLCTGPIVEKTRHYARCHGHLWEIDVFEGLNAGLIVAEIELSSEDEVFTRPAWVGEDVSEDTRYYNAQLARRPFREWERPPGTDV